jgi:general secretion pathway protein F
MALFRYEALDAAGKIVAGTMDSGTPAQTRGLLRDQGLLATCVVSLNVDRPDNGVASQARKTFRQLVGKRLDTLSAFSRHLALLLKSGVALAQALNVLAEQSEDDEFRVILQDLTIRVREGATFDDALVAHPAAFPDLYVCVARAGAASGNLPHLLTEIASYYTRQKKLRDRVISAVMYPVLMSAIGFFVVGFLIAYVVPKVTAVLLEQQRVLPWPTELLLFISNIAQNQWHVIIGAAVMAMIVLNLLLKKCAIRMAVDKAMLRVPILGDLIVKQSVARWADTMSNLLASGIPVAQALQIIRGSIGNRFLEAEIAGLERQILDGRDLSDALRASRILPKSLSFVVGVGEESGELPRVLKELAEGFNQEVEIVSERLTDVMNPILIVILGSIVGFIVAAILLPITDFSQIQ